MSFPPFEFVADPVWPWSIPRIGLMLLLVVGLAIAVLTIWTYRGSGMPRRRVGLVLALRLAALVLALLTIVRPSLAIREDLREPSSLIFALDASESMNIRDEADNQSRWATLQRTLQSVADPLESLRDKRNVSVKLYRFGEDIGDYDPNGKADGSRTDFGRMLRGIAERHAQDREVRGLLILSDGADNGTLHPAIGEAASYRARNCPIQTFALGQAVDASRQRDVAITSFSADPSPVPIKGKLTLRASMDAVGYENADVDLHVLIEDKETLVRQEKLKKAEGNEIRLEMEAPSTPGEYKVTLKADPLPGEASVANNEITTYITVTKEGVKVFVVDRLRTELAFLRRALANDPRIHLIEAIRQTDDASGGNDAFQFEKQAYDVIVLGDVTARRLRSADPKALAQIEALVRGKGAGFLMMGGAEAFGSGDWRGTEIEALLPVSLDVNGQSDEPVRFVPTREGLNEYVLRMAPSALDTETAWRRLPPLDGFSRLGKPKPGAVVLAETAQREPLMVRQNYGKGRTVALAVDTTWLWHRLGLPKTNEGLELHARFWKQLMLYLAQQENQAGAIWLKPDARRVAAGGKLGFSVGLRGKSGLDLPGEFEATVTPPGGNPEPVPLTREGEVERGSVWKTDKPGEYVLTVKGKGKDADGEVSGETSARFVVYRDDTELLRQAADHDFLTKLATAGGGKFYRAEELKKVLEDMLERPAASGKNKASLWPDWRRKETGALRPLVFALFVALLGCEWGLRRYWGMV